MAKILIVDDTVVCRTILSLLLTQQGHKVTVAEDGHVALNDLKAEKFDLIILDNMMPNLSGLEVLQAIRKDHNACPVIIISGGVTPDEQAQYKALDVIDIHKKPADPRYLSDQVTRLFSKPKAEIKTNIHNLTLVGSRNAPFHDFLRKIVGPDETLLPIAAGKFNAGTAVIDPNAVNVVQFAEDLTPAGQKLLEEKMPGMRVVLCTAKSIDDLDEAGFSPRLLLRFGIRTMPVPDGT
jgi:DNA-binding response OmpR family regulator